MPTAREEILDIFQYAFRTARVERVMQERLHFLDEVMEIDSHRYDLARFDRCVLISMGKAAEPMVSSFLAASGAAAKRFEGIIVAPDPVEPPSERFIVFQAGHPSPNAASLEAAETILRLVELTEGIPQCHCFHISSFQHLPSGAMNVSLGFPWQMRRKSCHCAQRTRKLLHLEPH